MLQRLFLILTFIIIGRPQDFLTFLIPLRLVLILTFFVMIGAILTGKIGGIFNSIKNPVLRKYFLLYAIMIATIPFSVYPGKAFGFVISEHLVKVLYFCFFVIIITTKEDLEKILFVICISNLFYAGFSLLVSGFSVGRFKFGSMYDPNDLAYFLTSLFPMSLYFLSVKNSKLKKIIAISTIAVSILVAILTSSRGGFLGLLAVGIFFFFANIRPFKMPHKIGMILLILIVVSWNITKVDSKRFYSIFNPEDDYNVTSEEGRVTVWKRGLELTKMHPITGVGGSCFPVAIGQLREKLGIPPRFQAPHNSFIQILTELGIPGFVVFLLMLAGVVKILYRNSKKKNIISPSKRHEELMLLSKILLLSFTGNIVTSFFLSMAYSPILTLFVSLAVALQAICEKEKETLTDESAQKFHRYNNSEINL